MYRTEAFDRKNHRRGFNEFGNCFKGFRARFEGQEGNPWVENLRRHFSSERKAVNIEETDEYYVLYLYAAGLKKENFSISLSDNILTIRYRPDENSPQRPYIYEEYQPEAFERSFQLNGQIAADEISAGYTDGVLTVSLPKNRENAADVQEIKIG